MDIEEIVLEDKDTVETHIFRGSEEEKLEQKAYAYVFNLKFKDYMDKNNPEYVNKIKDYLKRELGKNIN